LNKNNYFYPKILESEIKTITAIPQLPKPGEFFPNKYGDELFFYKNDEENFQSKVTVVDPTKLLEGNYKLTFNGNSSWQNVSWNLSFNENSILQNQKIIFSDPLGKDFPVYFNGLEIYSFVVDTNNFDPSNMIYEFTFHSSGSIHNNQELAKKHVESINVFPNPYYCTQVNEIHQFDKYVTFSHLPQKAKIRIFNLAGHLIRTINKNDESQFLRWDLTNENNFWIASGVYIVYIELPELGETKILKLAVLIENVVPDYF